MVKSPELQHINSPPATAKRKKTEGEDPNGTMMKNKRSRVSFSCGECHRRKQKCDRKVPCSHCVARNVPELCKIYTPGKSDQDLSVRLARLEHIVEMALPQFCSFNTASPSQDPGSNGRRRSGSLPDDDGHSQPDEQDPSGGSFHSGKWYGHSASGSVAPGSVLEQLKNVVVQEDEQNPDKKPNFATSSSGPIQDPTNGATSIMEAVAEPSAADNLKSLVQECGVSPHKISELLQELPPSRSSDVLVDYYFTSINWTRYPVSEKDFRAAYCSICAHGADGIAATNPNDVRFLPLLFVVLAIAVRLAPEHIGGDTRHRRLTSLRYYWSSRRSLLIAAAIQPDSLDIVLTRLLSARFLTFDRRITECWSQLGAAVRTAQALGLHRDGSRMPGMDPAQVEYRRRIWSYLYHADRSYALVLGRPNSIQDDYTSTKPPSNIDDSTPSHIQNPPPLSTPTPMTFVILRHQLAAIIGRMVHHFQQVKTTSHYSEVVTIDDELLKFMETLPPHFALDPDTSLDETAKYIPVHRFLLITEILFVRISLHRPYLLRKLRSERFNRSRNACFESAMKDFQVRLNFRQTIPKERRDSLSNAYREFQTAMISGIYLVLHPRGKYAQQMHAILDGFLHDHEGMRELDETTRRELKIIEFLKARASQAENQGGDVPTSRDHPVTTTTNGTEPAQLLLSLQQSGGAASPASRPSFPPILTNEPLPASASSPQPSPSLDFSTVAPLRHSPTFQRLQHINDPHSPAGSGSPCNEEESAAQSLLDHWCNTVSSGPALDGFAAMHWGASPSSDLIGWAGATPTLPINDTRLLNSLDGSDWTYWDALVNQIRGS